jgi:hypothetical protein
VPVVKDEGDSAHAGSGYDIQILIQDLQQLVRARDPRIEAGQVAELEWGFLAILDGHPAQPETLHTWLHEQPKFFVELLTLIFRRSDEPNDTLPEPSKSEKARATQAYRLLHSWQRVPGSDSDGAVDEDKLLAWVRTAQELSDREARREMCDLKIGGVLAWAPKETSDGTWPCIPVRDVIEEVGSDAMMDGFEVGIFNSRGVSRRAPDEGGVPERELAARYAAWAEAVKIEWPRTAASLRRVAEQYEADGRRWDAEAELRR